MEVNRFSVPTAFAVLACLLVGFSADAANYTLTVSAQGGGSVSKNPTNATYPPGVTVIVTATPSNGWYFANWSGDASGSSNPLNVTMNTHKVITGNFLAYPNYAVTLTTNGQGSIALNPAGGSYWSNTVVTATATPGAGWVFTGWSGSANSSTNQISFAVNTNLALTGNFAELPAFDVTPVSVTNVVGSTVSFTSHATGTVPLNYQWYFSGGSLVNATNPVLALTNAALNEAGNYWVIATNGYGSATSSVVSLTLTNVSGPTNVVSVASEASLRAAIALGGWVGLGFSGTITLSNTISISNNVILDGSGVSAMISGGSAVRLFYVAPGASLGATNLTLANGSGANGGAIYVATNGTVTLVACKVTSNQANGSPAYGGALFNNGGAVALLQTSFSNNAAAGGVSSWSMGGAVFQAAGTLMMAESVFSFNSALGALGTIIPGAQKGSPAYGGALAANGGTLTIHQSEFYSNTAQGGAAGTHSSAGESFGGAVYSAATLNIEDSVFLGNRTLAGGASLTWGVNGNGGAIYNSGTTALNRCSICSNSVIGGGAYGYTSWSASTGGNALGGGIYNASGQVAATNCTIALNSTVGGQGTVEFPPNLGWVTNGNALGGGIFNNTSATFSAMNLTIASNSCVTTLSYGGFTAGSQLANTNGTLRLHNSLIAGTNSNAYGPITDEGFNICSDGSASLSSGASYSYTDPQLAPLANYGGRTLCMALLPTSPAIDNADPASFPATDQRGYLRPADSGPDMGAYEYGANPPNPPGALPVMRFAMVSSQLQLSFTATATNIYRLQASTNLVNWSDVNTNGPFASATNIIQTFSPQDSNQRFFRLTVQ
jgi:hypothetical protein